MVMIEFGRKEVTDDSGIVAKLTEDAKGLASSLGGEVVNNEGLVVLITAVVGNNHHDVEISRGSSSGRAYLVIKATKKTAKSLGLNSVVRDLGYGVREEMQNVSFGQGTTRYGVRRRTPPPVYNGRGRVK
jgi:hypothetical protein